MTGQGDATCDGASGFIPPTTLYVHVPLCRSKCSYCDFFSVPATSLSDGFEAELVGAILERAAILSARFGADAFKTVYVGGGTPTILSPKAFDTLLNGIEALACGSTLKRPKEWTVEANPESLSPELIEIMLSHGVTRLSIGVQSLEPVELATLGRIHGPEAALRAVRLGVDARMAISADLIAGIPSSGESTVANHPAGKLARFAGELADAGAGHLSVYDLTIEKGTPLDAAKGHLHFPNEDDEWEARQSLESTLLGAGMRRYEISNYSRMGDECLHNLAYWRMESYLGAGPGAVSTIVRRNGMSLRIEEAKTVEGYRRFASQTASENAIGLRDAVFESVMMAFRTSFGLDLDAFNHRFGMDAEALIGDSLTTWNARIRVGEPWPGKAESAGPALDGQGLDVLNRFLIACSEEIDRKIPL